MRRARTSSSRCGARWRTAQFEVTHLGDVVVEVVAEDLARTVARDGCVSVGPLAAGGYGVGWPATAGRRAPPCRSPPTRAVACATGSSPTTGPDRDVARGRRPRRGGSHLTAVQFYDWAYRHADLLGGGERLRRRARPARLADDRAPPGRGLHAAGLATLGLRRGLRRRRRRVAAWEHDALLTATASRTSSATSSASSTRPRPTGSTTSPATSAARSASVGLRRLPPRPVRLPALGRCGRRHPGRRCGRRSPRDRAVRDGLPDARLVFNNVNDFPTWRTARSRPGRRVHRGLAAARHARLARRRGRPGPAPGRRASRW